MAGYDEAAAEYEEIVPLKVQVAGICNTTGAFVWPGARGLLPNACDAILKLVRERDPDDGMLNVLELGSGTGWLALNVARLFESRLSLAERERGVLLRIVVSEQVGEALELLSTNIEHGKALFRNVELLCAELDWNNYTDAATRTSNAERLGPFDLLLGSDLVYNKVCVELLPKLAEHFLLYTIPPVPTGPALDPFHPIPCSCTSCHPMPEGAVPSPSIDEAMQRNSRLTFMYSQPFPRFQSEDPDIDEEILEDLNQEFVYIFTDFVLGLQSAGLFIRELGDLSRCNAAMIDEPSFFSRKRMAIFLISSAKVV